MNNWHKRFLDMAHLVASWSKDPSTQVGAVMVDERKVVQGVGFNGLPMGMPDEQDVLGDRQRKRMLTVHAEMNLLHFCNSSPTGLLSSTIYVTHHPCAQCAANLAQNRPLRIVIPAVPSKPLSEDWAVNIEEAKYIFHFSGIPIYEFDEHYPSPDGLRVLDYQPRVGAGKGVLGTPS